MSPPTKSQLDDAAEADPDDPLGQIAFALDRSDAPPREPDTEIEHSLGMRIANNFADSTRHGSLLTHDDVEIIRGFLDTGKYSKIFKRPSAPKVYRGMGVQESWLRTALKMGRKEHPDYRDTRTGQFTYTPSINKPASSWSFDYSVAKNFARENSHSGIFAVVLTAKTSANDFITGPGGLYKLMYLNDYVEEEECIGLGSINVSQVDWFVVP
jgi:hypothetical protein